MNPTRAQVQKMRELYVNHNLSDDDQSYEQVHKYADDILSGKIKACKHVRKAAERHFKDLYRSLYDPTFVYEFDPTKAQRVIDFYKFIKHTKGKLARSVMKLMPWQQFCVGSIVGWVDRSTGFRRFKQANIWVARKNGKSTLASGLGLYFLIGDGEVGAEIYSIAVKKDQAKIVFDDAVRMLSMSELKQLLDVKRDSINFEAEFAKFIPLASDSNSLDGLNTHCFIADELHSWKDRNLWGVMETSTGAREQPLAFSISTAGWILDGIGKELFDDGVTILENYGLEENVFSMNYTLDDGDKFADRSVWIKANPCLGVSVKEDDIDRLCRKAERMSSERPNFLTKRLNVWVNNAEAWLDLEKLYKCANQDARIEDFYGRDCIIGVDFADYLDLTAVCYLFPNADGTFNVFYDCYLPNSAMDKVSEQMRQRYLKLDDEGWLNILNVEAMDYGTLGTVLEEATALFNVQTIAYDPYHMTAIATQLEKKKLPMVSITQSKANLSEAAKLLERYIYDGSFIYNGDKTFEWTASCAMVKADDRSNITVFRENHNTHKIDPVIATIIALSMAEIQEKPKQSPYSGKNGRGLIILG
ncbi:terminase large subunit [Vibrio fortis]|uniref:Terminase large subunit n=1 Tax=Vibrio fortis TaxID=212667 RepID=A0A5N3QTJ9_9VIBR|nr:terminase TerL endonuclease subunit [Vibrio fortis]KAB0285463.1 terminase large subunit [Vibrio fortis]